MGDALHLTAKPGENGRLPGRADGRTGVGRLFSPAVPLLALLPVLAVLFSFVLPYGASLGNAFRPGGEITVWQNPAVFSVTLFTVKQAFFSVLVSLALGLPGAWFIGNSRSRSATVLRSFSAVPFAMPSILVVLGFVLFFGNSGWVNRLYGFLSRVSPELTGNTDSGPLRILYKPEAIILAHGFYNFPIVMRLVGDGLSGARKAYSPAAAALGASPLATIFTVILPISAPSLISAVLLVFLYSFTSFAVVLVLGGGPASTTLAVEIYRHAGTFLNYRNAGALAVMETLIAVSVFLAYVFCGKKFRDTKTDLYRGSIDVKESPFPAKIPLVLYGLAAAFFIMGPLLSIPLESLLFRPSRSAAQELTLRWWRSLGDTCLPALFRSLSLAFFSATAACVLAFLSAGAVKIAEDQGRGNPAVAHIIRFSAAAPLVSSGIVLGLGWLIMYGRDLSRTPLALVVLHSVSALPFAFNSISEGFRSLPSNTLNAASVFGAGPLKGLLTTALPLSFNRIRSAWGFAAALSLGELNAVMMLGIKDWETLPLYIFRAAGAYRYGAACAAGTLLILGCAGGFLLSDWGKKHD